MVSTRISFAILAAYVATVAVAKPYAPELYARSGLVQKREVAASRPYAPEILARDVVEEDSDIVIKRSADASFDALSFLGIRDASSEEEMHARGLIADSVIEKRGKCEEDANCDDDQYCSSKSFKCFKKLKNGKTCSRDGACSSDFCNPASDKCQDKKKIGSRCRGDDNQCSTGYCSVITDRCHKTSAYGGNCYVDAGCKGNLTCVNGKCKIPAATPEPSGSATRKRELTQA